MDLLTKFRSWHPSVVRFSEESGARMRAIKQVRQAMLVVIWLLIGLKE